jgi:hypothetical protein
MPFWRVTAQVRHGQFDWPGTIERFLDAPDEEAALEAVAEKVREDGHHVDSSNAEPIPPAPPAREPR